MQRLETKWLKPKTTHSCAAWRHLRRGPLTTPPGPRRPAGPRDPARGARPARGPRRATRTAPTRPAAAAPPRPAAPRTRGHDERQPARPEDSEVPVRGGGPPRGAPPLQLGGVLLPGHEGPWLAL